MKHLAHTRRLVSLMLLASTSCAGTSGQAKELSSYSLPESSPNAKGNPRPSVLANSGVGNPQWHGRRNTSTNRPSSEVEHTFKVSDMLWDASYSARGEFTFTQGEFSKTLELPTTIDTSFDAGARTLLLFGEQYEGDTWRGLGLIFHLNGPDASLVRRLSFITPYPEGGTYSFGFPLEEPLKWLPLGVGDESRALTTNGKYVLSVDRPDTTSWMFKINPTGTPEDWFTRGTLLIETSSSLPPWDAITIHFSLENSVGLTRGEAFLDIVERRG